jgi:uncharacterized protein YqeY
LTTRERLQADLKTAMTQRDQLAVITIRALIGAIDNAGAVPVEDGPYEVKIGLGHDVGRRRLSEGETERIVASEHADLDRAAEQYEELGQTERAAEFRRRAEIARVYLP